MAVTAEDKKYLSAQGLSAVQKATDDWNKANSIGDKAGMAAAAAAAAAARNSAGYTSNSSGQYVSHTPAAAPVASPVKAPTTVPTQPVKPYSDPYAGRDIAGEIISLLTSGGPIDYSKVNSLVQQRDAKIAANPGNFSQFESTQDIINRYLPIAQENERLKAQTGSTDINTVIDLLTQIGRQPSQYMSFDEAKKRAEAELNPMYESAASKLMGTLNSDMERRGIYNAPLASGIMTEKMGALSNDQIAALAQRANTLIQNDAELTLQEKQLQSNTLNALLSSLIGREANLADITGYYNGSSTLNRQKYESDKALQEGELTGNYNGKPTLASKQFDLQASTQRINNALNAVQSLGKVTTQEQANLLGVPVGTPSWQAAEAAASRQQELQMFNREMSYKNQSLALQGQQQNASKLLDNFNKDMAVWEATGKSPDTEAMRHYGIAPGTAWTTQTATTAKEKLGEAQAQIELISAEEELAFQGRASTFMKSYSVSRGVAEAALLIIDQSGSMEEAQKIVKAQKGALEAEGINTSSLSTVLTRYYNAASTYGGALTGNDGETGKAPTTGKTYKRIFGEYLDKNFGHIPENTEVYDSKLNKTYIKRNGDWYLVN